MQISTVMAFEINFSLTTPMGELCKYNRTHLSAPSVSQSVSQSVFVFLPSLPSLYYTFSFFPRLGPTSIYIRTITAMINIRHRRRRPRRVAAKRRADDAEAEMSRSSSGKNLRTCFNLLCIPLRLSRNNSNFRLLIISI